MILVSLMLLLLLGLGKKEDGGGGQIVVVVGSWRLLLMVVGHDSCRVATDLLMGEARGQEGGRGLIQTLMVRLVLLHWESLD